MTLATHDRTMNLQETARQIGMMNVLAISGGRIESLADGSMILPVAHGYKVRVSLAADDTYNVERLLVRNSRVKGVQITVKGVQENVYCDEVGEVAYRASCYHHPFGD